MARIAVLVCDCIGQISDHLDTSELEHHARLLDDVVLVKHTGKLCGREELAETAAELADAGIDRLLVAACSPRMSLKLPEELLVATAERAGIDRCLVEVANIREQCAWIHRDNHAGATRKAKELLAMAHARLASGERAAEPVPVERRALVLGGGPAGLAAARDLARARCDVVLVEREPHLGGTLCQLPFVFQSEGWPSTCESACVGPVQALPAYFDERVTALTSAEVERIEQRDGNFVARISLAPRFVDADACLACGKCEEVCPEETESRFELGLGRRKAIARLHPRLVPEAVTLDAASCTRCGDCLAVCPSGAIDLEAEPRTLEQAFGALILATGTRGRDPARSPELGAVAPNVITALQLERLLAGGLELPWTGEAPEHVVFVQCAGSRAGPDKSGDGVAYCSKTCCAVTAKQAKRIATSFPMTEVSVVYYRDFRGYERALEKLHQDLRAFGVEFENGEVTAIGAAEDGELSVTVEPIAGEGDHQQRRILECDLVVLACAQEPQLPAALAGLAVPTDSFGFPIEHQPRLFRPTETFVDRVYSVGSAAGPKAIQQAVEQGSVAALRALEALGDGERPTHKHASVIDRDRCSRCGICLSVCPHGAIRLTDEGAVADPGFCQACGMCAASCPAHAAMLRNFSDDALLAEARLAFAEGPADAAQPRILALLCYWCAYGAADLAGVYGLAAPDCFRALRIRCSSSVNMGLVVEMFRLGIDGILIAGCPHNSCHHMWGNWLADKRTSMMRQLLKQIGLDERRLVFDNIGIMHAQRFVERIAKMSDQLAALGPNPWRRAVPAAGETTAEARA